MTSRLQRHIFGFAAAFLLMTTASPAAFAACTDPVGVAGEVVYNSTYATMAFCDNTNWISMAGGVAAGGGGGLTNGDKGDITVGGSGSSLTIDDSTITYSKMQDMTSGKLLGRYSAGTGNVQELTLGSGLSLNTSTGVITVTATAAANSLDFTELKDAMTLDASTDVLATGTNVFSHTNTGTGNSFVVNDQASDTTPFVIDAAGNVAIGTATADASALLTMVSTSQGFLPPRMTNAQVLAITTPPDGLLAYDATNHKLMYSNNGTWANVDGPGAGVTDGNKGDLTVSGSGATWTINNASVQYAKIQNVGASSLVGRYAATSGTAQEITIGSGLTLNSTTGVLTASGGGGATSNVGYVQVAGASNAFTDSGTTAGQQFYWDNTNKALGIGTATPAITSILELIDHQGLPAAAHDQRSDDGYFNTGRRSDRL